MSSHRDDIRRIVSRELARVAPDDARAIADEIGRRHKGAVAAVLYYGSCLRKKSTEGGVLDFYALVDSYSAAYRSPLMTLSNAVLPPNAFYVELPAGDGRPLDLRFKYNVITMADFARGASMNSLHAIIWGRFSQPTVLVHARDDATRATVADALVDAVLTAVAHMVTFLPGDGDEVRFTSEDLWQSGFRETYSSEFRTERPETIAELYRATPERYDEIAAAALRVLEEEGMLAFEPAGEALAVSMQERARRRALVQWRTRKAVAKALYFPRLLKSAATFGDWLPYALWKLKRHTGVDIEPTERQRRHPLIWGWPVLFRLLREQSLR